MNKRLFIIFTLITLFMQPASAVLKEDSLANSLAVLRHELITIHYEQNELLGNSKQMAQMVTAQIREISEKSDQNAIMLYSQKSDYIFDLAYACHEATEQYHEFQTTSMPFRLYINKRKEDIARYDSLVDALSTMYTTGLSSQAMTDRNVCLTLAVSIRKMLQENNEAMSEYISVYDMTAKRLKSLNDYAERRYEDLQSNIFNNGGDNYFTLLGNFHYLWMQIKTVMKDKYVPQSKVRSQWDARWIIGLFGIIIVYGFLSIVLNFISIRVVLTRLMRKGLFAKMKDDFMAKRTCIIMAASTVTFGLIVFIIKQLAPSNFVVMASKLLLEFVWLLAVILISLLLRVEGSRIRSTYRLYYPLIAIGFIVIAFRIVFIPSVIVNLVLPPLLLLTCVWQGWMLKKYKKNVQKYDFYLTTISQIVFLFTLFAAWMGYTLMSVQVLIWWIMQLTFILTMACIHDWLRSYREKHKLWEKPITRVWFFRLIYFFVLPAFFVITFVISIYWSADVFNLSDLTWHVFTTDYINTKNFKLSIFAVTQVIVLWFLFNYINHTARDLIRSHLESVDPSTAASRSVMIIKVLQVVIWGVWLLVALSIFRVSNTWLVVVSGGLSTGIGFAMKDILENIYYGISLMAGRIKIGDYIICDGIRGRVSSISYTSTMLDAIDGSVIAFQNSQLFTKNYKNMTKNHGDERDILEVGVAYGTNIAEVKKLLTDAIMKLGCINKRRGVKIVLKSFDDSCITLKILIWVNVFTQYGDDGVVMECVYNTLNAHGIDIPFPQREVTIKHVDNTENNNPTNKE